VPNPGRTPSARNDVATLIYRRTADIEQDTNYNYWCLHCGGSSPSSKKLSERCIVAGLNMNRNLRDDDDWVFPIVRQYFQTAQSGFPYIACPDELRPKSASADSWWVIYAPSYDGGVVVEGYLIRVARATEQTVHLLVHIWNSGILSCCVFRLVVVLGCCHWGCLDGAIAADGQAQREAEVCKTRWVFFPEKLSAALEMGGEIIAKRKAEEHRTNALREGIGKAAGKVAGGIVETVAGKAVGQLSEMAVEEAFKHLAHQLLRKEPR
jgi:hypothetical protein